MRRAYERPITLDEDRRQFEQFIKFWEAYEREARSVTALSAKGEAAAARNYNNQKALPIARQMATALNDLVRWKSDNAEAARKTASDVYASTRNIVIGVGSAGAIIAIAMALRM